MKPKQICSLCGEGKCDCDKDIRLYICPSCGSHKVKYVFGVGNIFGIIPKMKCSDCGYSAPSFPVIVTTKRKIAAAKEKLKKKIKIKRKKK